MNELTHIDLFSGIGGFALAARWTGFRTIVFCEQDQFCQRVLRKHWPDVPIISRIEDFDGKTYTGGTLLTGGWPCQPFSVAGKRRGKADNRYLWPEMLRVISEARPTWIIGENVHGISSLVQYEVFSKLEGKEFRSKEEAEACFKGVSEREGRGMLDMVLGDLEGIGYQIQVFIVPACSVNTPHRRYRVWIVGNTTKHDGKLLHKHEQSRQADINITRANRHVANAIDSRQSDNWGGNRACNKDGKYSSSERRWDDKQSGIELSDCHASNSNREGSQVRKMLERDVQSEFETLIRNSWQELWPSVATRLCRVDDGIPARVDRLRTLGNAIVPQVAAEIMRNIYTIETGRCSRREDEKNG